MKRRWGLGIGSLFSLIIVFFIYMYSSDKSSATGDWGWRVLAFGTKWYLLIWVGLIALVLLIFLIGLISAAIMHFSVKRQMSKMKKKETDVIDAEFRLKD